MFLKHLASAEAFSAEIAKLQRLAVSGSDFSAKNYVKTIDNGLNYLKKEDLINILNSLPVSVMLVNSQGRFKIINNKFTEVTGYRYQEIPDEESWFSKMYPDQEYRQRIFEKWQASKDSWHINANRDISITCRDGTKKQVVFSIAKLADSSYFVTMVDISELKEAEAKLQKSEESFWQMADVAKDPIYLLAVDGRFLKWNKVTQELVGLPDLTDKYFYNFLAPEDKKEVIGFYVDQYINKRELTYKEFPILTKYGEVWLSQNTVPKKDENDNIEGFLIISRNITEQKKLQKELEEKNKKLEEESEKNRQISACDPLTGLYNRRYFDTFFPQLIKSTSRYQNSLAVVFIDLNDFKKANDNYGHFFGDEVLKAFSLLLKESGLRETDIICRYGGDEFVLVFGGLEHADARINIEKRIQGIMAKWSKITATRDIFQSAHDLKLSLSVGVRLVDHQEIERELKQDNAFIDKIVKQADEAMYSSKEYYRRFGLSELKWHNDALLVSAGKYAEIEKYLRP